MFSEVKVTEIHYIANDICKEFALQQEKYMVEDKKRKHRNRLNRMNDAEIMVILNSIPLTGLPNMGNALWSGSSGSSCI